MDNNKCELFSVNRNRRLERPTDFRHKKCCSWYIHILTPDREHQLVFLSIYPAMASRSITRSCSHLSSASSTAARAFLQLAPRRQLHSTPLPLLDFLLPSAPIPGLHNDWACKQVSRAIQTTKRPFTSSSRRQQTFAIFNPRKDDDGIDMSVEITPRASNVSPPKPSS